MNCVGEDCATPIPLRFSAAINQVDKRSALKRPPWGLLLLLAAVCLFNSFAAMAQQIVYVEALKPENLASSISAPTGIYDTVEEAFAAHKQYYERSCDGTAVICTASDLHVCANNDRFFWGKPYAWCWKYKVIRRSDGGTNAEGITGGISWAPNCPASPRYNYQSVLVSGTGTPEDPRYFEDRCERQISATLPCCKDDEVGDQIYPANGAKQESQEDYGSDTTKLTFTRHYNSQDGAFSHEFDLRFVPPGQKTGAGRVAGEISIWDSGIAAYRKIQRSFEVLNTTATGAAAVFTDSDGARNELTWDGTRGNSTAPHFKNRLTRIAIGGASTWLLSRPDERQILGFDGSGRLLFRQYPDGRRVSLSYVNGKLSSISDDWGHRLQISQGAYGVSAVEDPAGQITSFTYADANKLTQVTYPDGTSRSYLWDEPTWSTGSGAPTNLLTGIIDETQQRFASFGYIAGKAVSTEHAGGVEKYSVADNRNTAGTIAVTDPLGAVRTTSYTVAAGVLKPLQVTQPAATSGTVNRTNSYDTSGNISSRTDFRGNRTCYRYDATRNLEAIRLEGLANNTTCPTDLAAHLVPTNTRQRKISTQWHPNWSMPARVASPSLLTTYVYNGQPDPTSGNAISSCTPAGDTLSDGSPIAVLCKRVEQETTDDTGTLGFNASLGTAVRVWTYTYNSHGQVLTADGPRTDVSDVTAYTYYDCTTGYQCGQVHTITNAAGHSTTYDTYNAHGQPLTITDANNVVTTLTYDLRQHLKSRTVGSEVTTFDYWPTGLLKKTTLPDGSYLEYTYDAAHRLTEINDAEGNRVQYLLDAMGNHRKEEIYDLSNDLGRKRLWSFDLLNHLQKEIGAAESSANTTTFSYDNNGNQTSIAAPLNRNSTQGYDELNRLSQTTDPRSGVTRYGYSALDQLISVTDPKGLVTSYDYNGLGELKQQISPDTGVTTNTYDSGGNLKTSTDARNVVTTYTYDALNRVATASFALGSTTDQTLTYSYDAGLYGKGRLTGVSDADHSLAWAYDEQGRVLTATQTIGSVSKTTSYSYLNGLRQSMTTPSGQVITYGYTNGKITSINVNGTPLVSNVLYEPFGPVRQWTWGNGTLSVRTFDYDGKITQIDSAGLKIYSYDDAFRITGITDASDPSLSWTYGYDDLDRLTSATKTGTTLGYTYDANGNRLTQTGSGASTFTIASSSNRLTSTSGALTRTYGYDSAGNTTSFEGIAFTYNNRGRMKSSTKNGVATNYTYNALGQMIKKGTSALYYYDDAGHVLGIYDASGALTEEIIWVGGIPLATLRPKAGGGVDIYNMHTDHLNTPRVITEMSSSNVRWKWDAEPFGAGAANENPVGTGVFAFDLRFPGQIYSTETGLHYNYFRDYDPSTGRYVQSDPIGLHGGPNTYAYVSSKPLSKIDPRGLIEWTGGYVSGGLAFGFGAGVDYYTLKSKCVNGKRGSVRFVGVGLQATLGIPVPVSMTAGSITFEDGLSDVDPEVFEGRYLKVSAEYGLGFGVAYAWVQAGGARSTLTLDNATYNGGVSSNGVVIGAGIDGMAGYSHVTSKSVETCCEDGQR